MTAPTDAVAVRIVTLPLCDLCLDGAGGECHVPGCSLWMNRAPDLPIRPYATVREETGATP